MRALMSLISAAVAVPGHDPQPSRALQRTHGASSRLSIPSTPPSASPSPLAPHPGSPAAAQPGLFAQPVSHSEPAPCAKAELNWKNTHNDLLWNVV